MSRYEVLKAHNGKVYFRGVNFSSVADIERQINDTNDLLKTYRNSLKQMIMSTPNDVTPAGKDTFEYLNSKADDIFETIEDLQHKLNVLEFASGIIRDWGSGDDIWEKAYVDQYYDLRKQLENENNKR